MPVNLSAPDPETLFPISGVQIGVTEAGVRKVGRKDLSVVLIDAGASVAGVFTTNRFCAAPVQICREHLASGKGVRAMLINTGNANAGTGADGLSRAHSTCLALAQKLGIDPMQVLPFSTGVIMEPLPNDRIEAGLAAVIADAKPGNWVRAAEGIMTTDTVPKAFGAQAVIDGKTVHITGISKGAGMIRPNMATMLGFIATDACVSQSIMQQLALELAEGSFNRVTVDGDTSTNDSLVVIASEDCHARSRTQSCTGHCPGWGRRNQVHHDQCVGWTESRGVPQSSLCHCPLAFGKNSVLRQRPQFGAHSCRRWLCGD